MAINTTAGTKLFIARDVVEGTPYFAAPESLAEYQAIGVDPEINDWVEVGEVEDLGEFGDEFGIVEFTSIGDRRLRRLKTTADGGTVAATVGSDAADQGQALMLQAVASDLNVPIRVVLADKITNGGSGTEIFNHGLVSSERRNVGTADNIIRRSFQVQMNGEYFEVSAT